MAPHNITAESRVDPLPPTLNLPLVFSGMDGSTRAQTGAEGSISSQDDRSLAVQPTANEKDRTPCTVSPTTDSLLHVPSTTPRVQCQTCAGCITRTMETALILLKDRLELVDAMEYDDLGVPSAGGLHELTQMFYQLFLVKFAKYLSIVPTFPLSFFLPQCFFLDDA
jgi:hypothetical protein